MKTGLNLTQLAMEIERRANAKRDLLAPAPKLQLNDDTRLAVGAEAFPINDLAHGQLAEYTGVPKAYYDRMRATAPHLLAANVNNWLQENKNDRRMVRTLDGSVRAFLSDRYRPLENEDLAEAVLPVLMDMDLIIMSSEITERRLYIKAVDRSIERDVPTGRKMGDGSHVFFDTVSPAVIISNSEVGSGRLSIETGCFTRVCTNLAMIGTNFRKQHVGGRAELLGDDVQALLSDNTKRLTDAAVWAQVRDVLKGAFDAVKFEAVTKKLSGAAEDRIEGDVVELVNRFAKRNAMPETTAKSVLRHLIESADLTRYGLHSAVTRASADVEDYDAATDLERLGGQVIELPKQAWQELLAA
jgi:hypothetical protein